VPVQVRPPAPTPIEMHVTTPVPTTPLGSPLISHQDCFGDAFILAVASVAGCAISSRRPDNDSIDWTLSCRLDRRPKLDVQMKTTTTDEGRGSAISYSLKRKNYDDLIPVEVICPRVLIVVTLPRDLSRWLSMSATELVLCHCAYWVSLRGLPPSDNKNTVTVDVPRANLFTPDSLVTMMRTINSGGVP
jgi:hypothetical protein